MSEAPQDAASAPMHYAYKPSLAGAPYDFVLYADRIEWRRGNRALQVFYRDIRKVRLAYRPQTMESHRFLTEIWSKGGPKLPIASTSWQGLVRQVRHDADYTAFIRELHRRIAASGATAEFRAGSPAPLYWPGVLVLAGLAFGVVALAVEAMKSGGWLGFAVIGAMLLFFLYQSAMFFRRNLPGSYSPDALPPRVLP
jgi:hypothetical protein